MPQNYESFIAEFRNLTGSAFRPIDFDQAADRHQVSKAVSDAVIYAADLEVDVAMGALARAPKAAAEELSRMDDVVEFAYGDFRLARAPDDEREMLGLLYAGCPAERSAAQGRQAQEILRLRALAWSQAFRAPARALLNAFRLAQTILPAECETFEEFCAERRFEFRGASSEFVLTSFFCYVGFLTSSKGRRWQSESLCQLVIDIYMAVVESDIRIRPVFAEMLAAR